MRILLAASTALAFAASANAAVLFSDDFEAENGGVSALNYAGFSNWTVTGQVDLVATPDFGITCAGGGGSCVDLDGSSGPGWITSPWIAYTAGAPVTINFDVSGSQRSTAIDSLGFRLDFAPGLFSTSQPNSLPGGPPQVDGGLDGFLLVSKGRTVVGTDPWGSYFYTFNPTAAGTFQVSFLTGSDDNVGPLLDNVIVTQGVIPEPATWAMLIAGFGLVGTAARRRRIAAAA
jgi:hypothetical protein